MLEILSAIVLGLVPGFCALPLARSFVHKRSFEQNWFEITVIIILSFATLLFFYEAFIYYCITAAFVASCIIILKIIEHKNIEGHSYYVNQYKKFLYFIIACVCLYGIIKAIILLGI